MCRGAREAEQTRFIVFAEIDPSQDAYNFGCRPQVLLCPQYMTCGKSYFALLANWPLCTEPQITALRVAATRSSRVRKLPDVFSKLQHREFQIRPRWRVQALHLGAKHCSAAYSQRCLNHSRPCSPHAAPRESCAAPGPHLCRAPKARSLPSPRPCRAPRARSSGPATTRGAARRRRADRSRLCGNQLLGAPKPSTRQCPRDRVGTMAEVHEG